MTGPDNEVVIVSAVRSPIGRIRGVLAEVRPDDLAALVVRQAVAPSGIDASVIDEVFLGCANQAGEDNRNVARMTTLLAGSPEQVPAVTINRLCASGLAAVNLAARTIRAGEGEVIVAGGLERMNCAPYALAKNHIGVGPNGNATAWDTSLGWRSPNQKLEALHPLESMGETTENVYELSMAGEITGGEITREEHDAFAVESHARAVAAISDGQFRGEIVQIEVRYSLSRSNCVDVDAHPRVRLKHDVIGFVTEEQPR